MIKRALMTMIQLMLLSVLIYTQDSSKLNINDSIIIRQIIKEIASSYNIIILENTTNDIVKEYIESESRLIARYPSDKTQIINERKNILKIYLNKFNELNEDNYKDNMLTINEIFLSMFQITYGIGPKRNILYSKLVIVVKPRPAAIYVNGELQIYNDIVQFNISNGNYIILIKEKQKDKCRYNIVINYPTYIKKECILY